MTSHTLQQKRIDNLQWAGVSGLSRLPSLPDDGRSPALKVPLFYLTTQTVNNYEYDLYFVNNSDETLSFVAPFMLYKSIADAKYHLSDDSADNKRKLALYADDINQLYMNVLPKQGVRIDRIHIVYDSDYLLQWFIHLPFRAQGTHHAIWRFNVLEKGGVSKSYPLLWDDLSVPTRVVAQALSQRTDMPIEPIVYDARCALLDTLTQSYGADDAVLILAINDVLYRYSVGWSAPYGESDIQAKDIAYKLKTLKPSDNKAVQQIIQDVYDFWFNKGFVNTVSEQVCYEILAIYHAFMADNTRAC